MKKQRMSLRLLCATGLWLLASTFAQANLPVGISGPWYNPAQSGHGFSIEILAQNRALVFWYVYDPQGNPIFLYVEGQIVGRRIEGNAYAPRGMRFGEFDPSTRQLPPWGSISIDFSDCTHATLQWNALDAAYGSGQMPIRQITPLAGQSCELPTQNRLPTGLYEGVLDLPGTSSQISAWGFVDRDSKLWAIERWDHGAFLATGPGIHQGQYSHFERGQYVSTATIERAGNGDELQARMRVYSNRWYATAGSTETTTGDWHTAGAAVTGEFASLPISSSGISRHRWREGAGAGIELTVPISIAQLRDVYTLEYYEGELLFVPTIGQILIDEFGTVCVRVYASPCDLTGRIETPDGDIGLVQFELHSTADSEIPAFRGRGWLSRINGRRILTLTGNNGSSGLGLVGRAPP